MGESLFLSWLRHVKSCQIVQMNWKPSDIWQRIPGSDEVCKSIFDNASQLFQKKYQYNLFGDNGFDQLIMQAEIDVLGIFFVD